MKKKKRKENTRSRQTKHQERNKRRRAEPDAGDADADTGRVPYMGMRGVTSPQCQSRVMARHSATVPSGQTSSMARQSGIRNLLVLEWLKRARNRGTRR